MASGRLSWNADSSPRENNDPYNERANPHRIAPCSPARLSLFDIMGRKIYGPYNDTVKTSSLVISSVLEIEDKTRMCSHPYLSGQAKLPVFSGRQALAISANLYRFNHF